MLEIWSQSTVVIFRLAGVCRAGHLKCCKPCDREYVHYIRNTSRYCVYSAHQHVVWEHAHLLVTSVYHSASLSRTWICECSSAGSHSTYSFPVILSWVKRCSQARGWGWGIMSLRQLPRYHHVIRTLHCSVGSRLCDLALESNTNSIEYYRHPQDTGHLAESSTLKRVVNLRGHLKGSLTQGTHSIRHLRWKAHHDPCTNQCRKTHTSMGAGRMPMRVRNFLSERFIFGMQPYIFCLHGIPIQYVLTEKKACCVCTYLYKLLLML